MKKLFFFSVLLMMTQVGLSQVGINTANPNAQLDIRSSNQATPSNNDGILIPKIDAFPLTNPAAVQQGMLVYLTTLSAGKQPGFYYWDNVTATWLGLGGSSGWALTGNSGTNPATNFIGTTDATDVVFRRDNVISGKIGMANTSFGRNSMNPLSSGIYNSAFGLNSMSSNTSGNSNSAFGNYALNSNTSGNANTAFGSNVMYTNTTGQQNTAFGSDALEYNTTGNNNSAIGYYSLYNNFIGNNNTAHGFETLRSNQTGGFNTAIGSRALQASVTGAVNTAIGDDALSKSNGADLNVAVGGSSMLENLTGSSNTAVGSSSLRNNVATNRNTAIGYEALYSNTGSDNTALGYQSNILGTTGSRNTTIGANANVADPAGNDQLSIANVIYGSDLNSTATGKIGIGVPVPTEKLEVAGKTKTTNFQMTTGGALNRLMVSDAQGNGSWQTPTTALNSFAWTTTGNSGLNAATNFIGTTDNVDFIFKRNNIRSGIVQPTNTSLGVNALNQASTGIDNVAFGKNAMAANTTANMGTAIGSEALAANQTGISNVAIGNRALSTTLNGGGNVAVGTGAMIDSKFCYGNVGVGHFALAENTTGIYNVAIGNLALGGNSNYNVAIGSESMRDNLTGQQNTAIGLQAMEGIHNGSYNTATGMHSLLFNHDGNYNSAYGWRALHNILGSYNTGLGVNAMVIATSGDFNTVVGTNSLLSNTGSNNNTTLGYATLQNNILGSGNIAIGNQAGLNEIGSNRLYIENSNSITPLIYGEFDTDLARINGNFRVNSTTVAGADLQVKNSNLFIHNDDANLNFGAGFGYFMLSTQDNSGGNETGGIRGDGDNVSIWSPGDGGRQLRILDEDNWNDNNGNPYDNGAEVAYIAANGQYFQVSDKNKKENIKKIEDASEKIAQISGYTYHYKLNQQEIEKGQKPVSASGVLAQEVEQILPEAIQKNESGEYFVDYAAITPLLIEAIKEQNAKIKSLETTNAEILKRLEKLENK